MKLDFKKWFLEMVGTGAIVNSCRPTASYQIWGSCSNLKKRKKK